MENKSGNTFIKRFLFLHVPLLAWALVIFVLSSLPGNGYQSYDLATLLERKGAHVLEYGVLSILWIRVLRGYFPEYLKRAYIFSAVGSLIYAASDEFHQTFIFGRTGKITDLLIDFAGILLGVAVYHFWVIKKA